MQRAEFAFPVVGKCVMNVPDGQVGEFILRQFKNYLIKTRDTSRKGIKSIEVFNEDIVKQFKNLCEYSSFMLSRDFRIENDFILANGYKIYLNKDRIIIYKVDDGGYLEDIKNTCRKIKKILPKYKYNYCSGIYTQYYLNALFFVYAAYKNFMCVHGSCVSYKGRNFLITGLDGVGKSSMALLFSDIEGEILADNMVLYKEGQAINMNLAMRVDPQYKTKYEELYLSSDFKEVLPNVCDRDIINIDSIFCLLKTNGNHVEKREFLGDETDWIMYLNGAQEVNNANKVMMPWIFLNSLREQKEPSGEKKRIVVLCIPSGSLLDAREEIIKCL